MVPIYVVYTEMKKQLRVETLSYQQHVVTIRAESLDVDPVYIRATSVSGESLVINVLNFVWMSKDSNCIRLCFNKLIPSSGLRGARLTDDKHGFARFKSGSTVITVNKKFHKLLEIVDE